MAFFKQEGDQTVAPDFKGASGPRYGIVYGLAPDWGEAFSQGQDNPVPTNTRPFKSEMVARYDPLTHTLPYKAVVAAVFDLQADRMLAFIHFGALVVTADAYERAQRLADRNHVDIYYGQHPPLFFVDSVPYGYTPHFSYSGAVIDGPPSCRKIVWQRDGMTPQELRFGY